MLRRFAALVILAGAAVLVTAAPAAGHAALLRSNPLDGAQLTASPPLVELGFTERPDPALTIIEVLDEAGSPAHVGAAHVVAGNSRAIAAKVVHPLRHGVYTIVWRTVSLDDGHPSSGRVAFGVGAAAAPVAETGSSGETPSPYGVAGRWALYCGLSLCLAAGVCGLVVSRTPAVSARMVGAGWLAAAVGAVMLGFSESRNAGVSFGTLLAADRGAATVRLTVAVAVAGISALVAVRRPGRLPLTALALTSAAGLVVRAASGHASAATSLRTVTIAVQAVHVVAVGAWMGGLAWLLYALRAADREARPALTRRFSALAAGCLAAVVLSGTARSVAEIGSLSRLTRSGFGQVLLAKLAIVAALVAVAAASRHRVRRSGGDGLPRTVGAEVALGVVVLGASALLTGLAPPASTAVAAQTHGVSVDGQDFGLTTSVRLHASPGHAGLNELTLEVRGHDSGEPIDASRVTVRLGLPARPEMTPTTVDLRHVGDEWTATTAVLSAAGRWDGTVVVQRSADAVEVPISFVLGSSG